jgi:Phage virion morphogenesis family
VQIRITRDFGPLSLQLTRRDMQDVGETLITRIRARTTAGRSVSGAAFRPYSPGYAALKAKELGSAAVVNLTVSGGMLNDMHVTAATDRTATITFVTQGSGRGGRGTFIQRSRAVGAAQKAEWNNPTRPFFAASDEDEREISEALEQILQRRLDAL